MRSLIASIITICFVLFSCTKESDDDSRKFAPTEVGVKIKGYYTIDKVFTFINSFNHDVEYIGSQKYTSTMHSDSLQYVLDYLNAKSYTRHGNAWYVTGYLHYDTNIITIFPDLFQITNMEYQADWLKSMDHLELTEVTEGKTSGCIIFFHVPEGEEKMWEKKFEEYEFVEWAELNYYLQINPWP